MKRSDFSFDLPESLIAAYPAEKRVQSRLLHINAKLGQEKQFQNKAFEDILDCLNSDDLLIVNNTQVMSARIYGKKTTGGQVELLVAKIINPNVIHAYVKSSKSPKQHTHLLFEVDGVQHEMQVLGREQDLFVLAIDESTDIYQLMDAIGHVPLPPYMKRDDESVDALRYQTVYAKSLGAIAAPTAGLHFDESLLEKIRNKGVQIGELTLHVGAGTFQPMRVEDISEHQMHHEYVVVSDKLAQQIQQTREKGGRVIAVGTTVVRALETVSDETQTNAFAGETNIFIFPGYQFKCVDALITNFHLPESTLLMLVCAFAGKQLMLDGYQHAIDNEYRFYSYGDSMFIEPPQASLQFQHFQA